MSSASVCGARPLSPRFFAQPRTEANIRTQVPYLWLPTVTLFSFFDISVPTLWAPKRLLNFWQVEEAHAHAFLQAGLQVLPAAAAEHHGEGVPAERSQNGQLPPGLSPEPFLCRYSWWQQAVPTQVSTVSLREQMLKCPAYTEAHSAPEIYSCTVQHH